MSNDNNCLKSITVTINSKDITFYYNHKDETDNSSYFPRLYSKSKNGKEMWWQIEVCNDTIYSSKGFIDSSVITEYNPVKVEGKNIGKKNETNPYEQALLQAHSSWKKKIESGYYTKNDEKNDEKKVKSEVNKILPMLANKYTDKTKIDAKIGVYVSPKLDGIRALAYYNSDINDGKVEMWSRTAKVFPFFEEIKNSIKNIYNNKIFKNNNNFILDGELYSHDISFTKICSIVRKTKSPDPDENKITYYIFDIVNGDAYSERLEILKKIDSLNLPFIKVVLSEKVFDKPSIKTYHDKFVSEGYEGLMVRIPDSKYEIKFRSTKLLKYKEFLDEEFEIVDVVCSNGGTEDGCAIFVCKSGNDKSDKTFNVRPRGSFEHRRKQYIEKKKYIGKMLTVRWQPCQNSNINNGSDGNSDSDSEEDERLPRFGVGICIRDYE